MTLNVLSIDVEDWFHILDSPDVPPIEQWDNLEPRIEQNMGKILASLDKFYRKVTFFWFGWAAQRHKTLVRKCFDAGHEIASHGYGHVLAYEVGRKPFMDDICRGKMVLENITGQEILGFRAAGFSTKDDTTWVFDEIRVMGYTYDSSVFPSSRGHGGMSTSRLEPYAIHTPSGTLVEIPQSMIEIFGKRISVFGGGYLRLSNIRLIEYGIKQLERAGRPLIIYIHPREIDTDQPRLPLSLIRAFKSYFNLKTTMPKLERLLATRKFIRMDELASTIEGNSR